MKKTCFRNHTIKLLSFLAYSTMVMIEYTAVPEVILHV